MILLLRHWHDPVSDEIGRALPGLVTMLRVESWLSQFLISHTVGKGGADGGFAQRKDSDFGSGSFTLSINRVRQMTLPQVPGMSDEDQMYSASEACALFWSCLEALPCPVLNTPMAMGMVGRAGQPISWLAAASESDVPTADFALTTNRARQANSAAWERYAGQSPDGNCWQQRRSGGASADCWIVGNRVIGVPPGIDRNALNEFSVRLGIGFGRLTFQNYQDGTWRLAGVDLMPMSVPPVVFAALISLIAHHAHPQGEAAEAMR
jgi:hypothetical protein